MKDEELLNLSGVIIWAVVFIMAIVGIFWNPAQIATTIIAGGMFGICFKEYIRVKRNK